MPIFAAWPADSQRLVTLSTGCGSLMTSAWRTSRLARIYSTKPSVAPAPARPMTRPGNAKSERPVPRSGAFAAFPQCIGLLEGAP